MNLLLWIESSQCYEKQIIILMVHLLIPPQCCHPQVHTKAQTEWQSLSLWGRPAWLLAGRAELRRHSGGGFQAGVQGVPPGVPWLLGSPGCLQWRAAASGTLGVLWAARLALGISVSRWPYTCSAASGSAFVSWKWNRTLSLQSLSAFGKLTLFFSACTFVLSSLLFSGDCYSIRTRRFHLQKHPLTGFLWQRNSWTTGTSAWNCNGKSLTCETFFSTFFQS